MEYEKAEATVVEFEAEDIVATSGNNCTDELQSIFPNTGCAQPPVMNPNA